MKLINGVYSEPLYNEEIVEPKMKDHLIIVGFGFSGKTISKAAKSAGIPYLIVEMNPETVQHEKAKGENIQYGDATFGPVLEHAGIKSARVIVIGIADFTATRKIVEGAKGLNPSVCTIAKVHDLKEMKRLNSIGADEIIPEQYETSVEIFVRLLEKYLVPKDKIEKMVNDLRANGYRRLRKLVVDPEGIDSGFSIKEDLPGTDIQVLKVERGSSFDGKTLSELDFRKKYGVTVISVRRCSNMFNTPAGDFLLKANDACILLGKNEDLYKVRKLFDGVHS